MTHQCDRGECQAVEEMLEAAMADLQIVQQERDELKATIRDAWEAMDPEAPQEGDFVERCKGMTRGHMDLWDLERRYRIEAEKDRDEAIAEMRRFHAILEYAADSSGGGDLMHLGQEVEEIRLSLNAFLAKIDKEDD